MAIASQDKILEVLREAPMNTWIALSEEEGKIVAVGNSYAEAAANSEQAGYDDSLIMRTPEVWAPLYL
jgi:hypothetical protein